MRQRQSYDCAHRSRFAFNSAQRCSYVNIRQNMLHLAEDTYQNTKKAGRFMNQITKLSAKYLKMIEPQIAEGYQHTRECVIRGILIDPVVPITKETADVLIDLYGIDLRNANATFYKTFEERENKLWEEVVFDRVLHYMATYGGLSEFFGHSFIPNDEEAEWQHCLKNTFTRIKVVNTDGIKQAFQQLVNQPLALPSEDIQHLASVVSRYGLDHTTIQNKELQIILADKYGKYPKDPELFVRCLVYKLLGTTQYFKSVNAFNDLRFRVGYGVNTSEVKVAVQQYIEQYGIQPLADHFRPNKQFWLILKKIGLAKEVNKMKRLSDKSHVSHEFETILDSLPHDLTTINTYQLIRWINYVREQRLLACANDQAVQIYRVRNGKAFVKELRSTQNADKAERSIVVLGQLVDELERRFKDKNLVFYCPETHIDIKLPTTAKSFVGNYPMLTTINVPEEYQVGVYWNEQGDIDLHAITMDGRHVGFYSENVPGIVYTGDMTALNHQGFASEAMLSRGVEGVSYSMNPFSALSADACKIYVATYDKDVENVVSDGDILFQTSINTDTANTFAVSVPGNIILTTLTLGGRVPQGTAEGKAIDAIARKARTTLSLNEFAAIVGATFTDNPEEATHDFSQKSISLASFTTLLED